MDSSRFDPVRLARMHAAMQRHVESDGVPGLVMLVQHRGREHAEAIGKMAYHSTQSIRLDTIFRLASMTKPITAVGAMILVEECKVRLDDAVDEWLPELKNRRVLRTIDSPLGDTAPAKRSITLRDLLTFRSGYGEVGFVSPTCPLQKAMIEAELPPPTPLDRLVCWGKVGFDSSQSLRSAASAKGRRLRLRTTRAEGGG